MRKQAQIFITILLALSPNALLIQASQAKAQQVYKASVQHNEYKKGKYLWVLPETIVDSELNLRGDKFLATLTDASAQDFGFAAGTKVYGKIVGIRKARSHNKNAQFRIILSRAIEPNGKIYRINGKVVADASKTSSKHSSGLTAVSKKILKSGSKLTAASLVGAVDTLQVPGGFAAASMTSGISVLAGAGLGLGMGIKNMITQEGEKLIVNGFDLIGLQARSKIKVLGEYRTEEVLAQELQPFSLEEYGLDFKINDADKLYSETFGDFVLFDLELSNNSARAIHLNDLVLSSDKNIKAILLNPFLTDRPFRVLQPGETLENQKIAFMLAKMDKKSKYKFEVRDPGSDRILASQEIKLSEYL